MVMTQSNAEVVRAGYAAWGRRDLEGWLETLDPEIEFRTSGVLPDLAPVYRGHDGMRSFWDAMIAPWESFHLDVERIVEGEGRAAVAIRFRARGKRSGVATDLRQGHALRFSGGRASHVSAHPTFEEALGAVDLSQ